MVNESRTRKSSSRTSAAKGGSASNTRKGAAAKRKSSAKRSATKRTSAGKRTSATKRTSSAKRSPAAKRTSTTKGRAAAKGGASKGRGASKRTAAKKGAAKRSTASKSRSPIGQSIEILMAQHKEVQGLFRQGERAKDDAQKLQPIVQQCCAMLTQHAEVEEAYFYPVMRENMKDPGTIAEAKVEHDTQKQLIAQLQEGEPGDEEYAATFTVLSEYVKHHVKEEENEIFPRARRVRADWQPLLDALQGSQAEQAEGDEAMQGKAMHGKAMPGKGARAGTGAEESGGALLRGGMLDSEDSGEGASRGRRPASRRSARVRGSEEAGEDTVEEGGTRGRDQEQDEQASRDTRSGSR